VVLENRPPAQSSNGKLTNQDLFYRQVSRIHDIIPALQKVEQNVFSEGSTQTVVSTIVAVNSILSVSATRQTSMVLF
jgi:hypothetical protein